MREHSSEADHSRRYSKDAGNFHNKKSAQETTQSWIVQPYSYKHTIQRKILNDNDSNHNLAVNSCIT